MSPQATFAPAVEPQKRAFVAADFLGSLTDDEKELTFVELLRQGLRTGRVPVPERSTEDEAVEATKQQILEMLSRIPPDRLRESDAALADLSKTVDALELLERFSREDQD